MLGALFTNNPEGLVKKANEKQEGNYTTAGIISILAISIAGSRLVSGTLSDKYGTLNVLKAVMVITIVSLLTLSFLGGNQILSTLV